MNLYEMKEELLELLEAQDYCESAELDDAIGEAKLALREKYEGVGVFIKSLKADALSLKAEEKVLADRRKAKENRVKWLENYLMGNLDGQKFETSKVSIGYRKSVSVNVTVDATELPLQYQRVEKKILADKTGLKIALKAGEQIQGVTLDEKQNIVLK